MVDSYSAWVYMRVSGKELRAQRVAALQSMKKMAGVDGDSVALSTLAKVEALHAAKNADSAE